MTNYYAPKLRKRSGASGLSRIGLVLATLGSLGGTVQGQSDVDSFNPGANGAVRALGLQADGKILVGGDFTRLGGGGTGTTTRNHIGRLNPIGTLDTAFDPGADGSIVTGALQADGKIIVGGGFDTLGGGGTGTVARFNIGRVNPDGTLDASFNPGANGDVLAMDLQDDGKILVGGSFTTLGGGGTGTTTRNHIGRLNADGTLDTTFNPGANGDVSAIKVQGDGAILVGGSFTTLGGGGTGTTARSNIGRLNANGTIDAGFDPGANSPVLTLRTQRTDGKILVGGQFTTLGGGGTGTTVRNFIGRLNTDGTIDPNFDPGANDAVLILRVQKADDKILVGGQFTTLGGGGSGTTVRNFIGRLNTDGTLDTSFDPGANGFVLDVQDQPDGKILVGGEFTTLGGGGTGTTTRNFIGRLAFPAPPVITSPLTATATVGQQFVYQFEATDATSLTVLNLPVDLTFDPTLSAIVGSPTTSGTFQVELDASNAQGTTTATLILTVQPAPSSGPVIISSTSATGRTNQPFSFQVITGGASPSARLSATGLPAGLTVDPITGLISGTATEDGSSAVLLTVTDGGLTTTLTLELTFSSDPALPVIISPSQTTLVSGQPFNYQIVAPSSDPSPVTYDVVFPLPPGLGLDPETGVISGVFQPGLKLQPGPPVLAGGIVTNVQLFATNSNGSATIPLAFFDNPSGARNISTRLAVGTEDDVLIGGFIITGNAPKKVLIRAIGPSLETNGVPVAGRLLNPTLELHDKDGLLSSNDDWRDSQEQQIIDTTIPPSDDRESAIVAILAPLDSNITGSGAYTVILRGTNNTTGVALVEVYDLGTASFDVASQAQLANISTRGKVESGDDVMIGGFIIGGSDPSEVLVRAIGPELTGSGVPGALQDTDLELHDGEGALIGSNDDWQSDQAQQIIDTGVPPTDPRESAIVATLSAGAYTGIVRGKNDTTGVALVEVYVIP